MARKLTASAMRADLNARALNSAECSCGIAMENRPLTRDEYLAYISSDRWRNSPARLAELEAAGHSCRTCDRRPPEVRLEVHHRTYARLGRELVRDLTTLCSDCHRAITDEERQRRHVGTALPALCDTWGVLPVQTLFVSDWIDAY